MTNSAPRTSPPTTSSVATPSSGSARAADASSRPFSGEGRDDFVGRLERPSREFIRHSKRLSRRLSRRFVYGARRAKRPNRDRFDLLLRLRRVGERAAGEPRGGHPTDPPAAPRARRARRRRSRRRRSDLRDQNNLYYYHIFVLLNETRSRLKRPRPPCFFRRGFSPNRRSRPSRPSRPMSGPSRPPSLTSTSPDRHQLRT